MTIPFGQRLAILRQAAVGLFTNYDAVSTQGLLAGVIGPQGAPPPRGTRDFLQAYSTMPWVRAIAGKIAFAFASTDWKLYTVQRERRAIRVRSLQQQGNATYRWKQLAVHKEAGNLVEIEEHPLLESLSTANAYQTGLSLRKLMMLYIDLVGECFLYKERNVVGGTIGLWPIPPHWVVSTPSVESPMYAVSYRGWQRDVPDVDILWLADPDPVNPYGRGVGHSRAVSDELETDEYAAKMMKQVFFNRAKPDLLVSPKEGTLLPEEVERLEHRWNTSLQGFHRVMKPFFVRKAVDVKEFGVDFQSLQMKDLRQHQRDIIMQVFGIPPEIMGVLTSSNRATIDSADYLFSKYVILPRLEFFRAQLQERLVPEYDDRLILDYVSPVQEDKELQLKAMSLAPWASTIDEWRAVQGLPELENGKGKVFAKPFNLDFSTEHQGEAAPEPVAPLDGESRGASARLKRLSVAQLREMRQLVESLHVEV